MRIWHPNLRDLKSLFNRKTVIMAAVLCAAAGLLLWLGLALFIPKSPKPEDFSYYEHKEEASGFVLENDILRFELDPLTTWFSVTRKDSGRSWKSNPSDADADPLALSKVKNQMKSTLLLVYGTENGVENIYDSFSYSVARKFCRVSSDNGSVRVDYLVGDVQRVYLIPLAVTEERMDSLVENMKDADRKLVLQYYRLYDIERLRSSDNEDELLRKYPILERENIYVVRDSLPTYLKEKIEAIFKTEDYGRSDYNRDAELYGGAKVKETPTFNVSVVYSLADDRLVVDVPFDDIRFMEEYPLTSLALLPYFGSAGTGQEGFIMVPEGGGGIIRFNNGKLKQNAYYSDMYGWDWATDRAAVIGETRNSFPVFGMSDEGGSFISIIEEGAAYAGINADVAGRYGSRNFAYASYKMIHQEAYDVSGKSNDAVFVFEDSLPAGERIRQTYRFLSQGGYPRMAAGYRDYLKARQDGLPELEDRSVPVAVGILGAADKIQQVLGFPASRPFRLTNYREAKDMLDDLKNRGFDNLHASLIGFLKGGIRQRTLGNPVFPAALGGNGDFRELMEWSSENGVRAYLGGVTQFAYDSSPADGFFAFRDAAKFASAELARLEEYSSVWYGKDGDLRYLLRPSVSVRMTDRLIRAAGGKKAFGLSLRDDGKYLSADYDPDRRTSRERARAMRIESMRNVSSSGLGLMTDGGNDYAALLSDFVTGMDFTGKAYSIIDETVPFYQMALHGHIRYSGRPLNLAADGSEELLRSAEYGAGLSFVFMKKPETALQDTKYAEYYGANYDSWIDRAQEIRERFDRELGRTYGMEMLSHERVAPDVTATDYEDGTRVYVNYGYEDFRSCGVVTPARSWTVIAGKGERE
jgi:hypothetical protein